MGDGRRRRDKERREKREEGREKRVDRRGRGPEHVDFPGLIMIDRRRRLQQLPRIRRSCVRRPKKLPSGGRRPNWQRKGSGTEGCFSIFFMCLQDG